MTTQPSAQEHRDATRIVVAMIDGDSDIAARCLLDADNDGRALPLAFALATLARFLADHVETEGGRDLGLVLHEVTSALIRMGADER